MALTSDELLALMRELCVSDDELGWVEAGAPEEIKAFERWERAWNAVRDAVHGPGSVRQVTRRLAHDPVVIDQEDKSATLRIEADAAHREVGTLTSLVLEAWRLQSVAPLEKVIVIHPGDGLPSVDLSKSAREQSAVVADAAPPLRPESK